MPVSDPTGTTAINLSRAEQWVVHHVLLKSIGLADGEPSTEAIEAAVLEQNLELIEKIEAGFFEFTPAELSIVKQACGIHARRTNAGSDENLASAVVDRIDTTVDDSVTIY